MKTASIQVVGRKTYSSISSDYKRQKSRGRKEAKTISLEPAEIFLSVMLFLLVGASFWTGWRVYEIKNEIKTLKQKESLIELRYQEIKKEREMLLSDESLEIAGKRLGLHPAKGNQVIVLK